MKALGKLKLNQFRKAELEKRALNALKGGCDCTCSLCSLCYSYGTLVSAYTHATEDGFDY
jgi:natural product precursor